jgi:hypothetical protein
VRYGPIIYPATMFGTEIHALPGESAVLAFELGSVAGLKKVELIGDGQARETRTFERAPVTTHLDFTVHPEHLHWYALVVEDQLGRRAYTDPIWVAPAAAPSPTP